MAYYIGVDGGGTKSIIALFDEKKTMIDYVRTTGSNHETLSGAFEEAVSVIMTAIDEVLEKNNLKYDDITEYLMGLAGVDHPFQHDILFDLFTKAGLNNLRIYNDGFIITKAGLKNGTGIGYNCGTGNGHWLAMMTYRAIYDDVCLAANKTSMTTALFEKIGMTPSRETVLSLIEYLGDDEEKGEELIRMLIDVFFDALNSGDRAAENICEMMAVRGAEYITAHLRKQKFESDIVDVVLSGSIHVKLPCERYLERLENECRKRDEGKILNFIILQDWPVMGCINWMLEESDSKEGRK
jgi:N-acetylglucosamine kinase-like BadF-type ATPase